MVTVNVIKNDMLLFMNIGFAFRFSIERQNVDQHISSRCSHFIASENIRKCIVLLMFWESIKREHWEETVYLLYEPYSAQGLSLLFCIGSV